jgi:sortase (surface protein transpeptidase)
VVSGSVLAGLGLSTDDTPKQPAAETTHALVRSALADAQDAAARAAARAAAAEVAAGLEYSVPKALTVPAIGVEAPVVSTGRAADGTPQIPPFAHPEQVGWYTSTVSPGERGASVLWGHLDTKKGTAVFQNLSALTPGDTVQVARADNRVATFTVERTTVYPREAVPADVLYDDPGYPALRLVTCGGRFDKKSQEYTSNIVVFARLTSVTAPLSAVTHPAPIGSQPTPTPTPTPTHAVHAKPVPAVPAAPKPAAPKPAASPVVTPKADPAASPAPPVPVPVPVPVRVPVRVPVPVAPKPEPEPEPAKPTPSVPEPVKPAPSESQQPVASTPAPGSATPTH